MPLGSLLTRFIGNRDGSALAINSQSARSGRAHGRRWVARGLCESGDDDIRRVCESSEVKAELKYISPSKLKSDYTDIDSPMIIIFNYPVVGGTHMNVIFNQKGDTVACMEPYFPFPGKDGQRSGIYVRRPLSFFANSQEIGIAYLPLADAFTQMQ